MFTYPTKLQISSFDITRSIRSYVTIFYLSKINKTNEITISELWSETYKSLRQYIYSQLFKWQTIELLSFHYCIHVRNHDMNFYEAIIKELYARKLYIPYFNITVNIYCLFFHRSLYYDFIIYLQFYITLKGYIFTARLTYIHFTKQHILAFKHLHRYYNK